MCGGSSSASRWRAKWNGLRPSGSDATPCAEPAPTMASVPAATYRRALDCLVTFDRQADLAGIGVPTLLVGGEFDRVAAPAVMKQMAASIAQARYAELPGIGHLMNLEAPDEFDALLLGFLTLALHVLPQIGICQFVQKLYCIGRARAFISNPDHAATATYLGRA